MTEPPPRRVLVIDDNVDCADTLKEVLELNGQVVDVAYDGEQGLEKATALEPEIVFCDIGLPGLDGYEVARRIRDQAASSPTLIAMSGHVRPEDRRRALDAGFDHQLDKPLELSRLEAILTQLIRPRR